MDILLHRSPTRIYTCGKRNFWIYAVFIRKSFVVGNPED